MEIPYGETWRFLQSTSGGITMGLRVYTAQAIPFEDVQDGYEFSKKEQIFLDLMDSCFR